MTFDKTLAGSNPGQCKTKEENGLLMIFCLTVSENWYICVQKRSYLLKDQAPKSVPTNGGVASASLRSKLLSLASPSPRHLDYNQNGGREERTRITTLRVLTISGVVLSVIKFVFGY